MTIYLARSERQAWGVETRISRGAVSPGPAGEVFRGSIDEGAVLERGIPERRTGWVAELTGR